MQTACEDVKGKGNASSIHKRFWNPADPWWQLDKTKNVFSSLLKMNQDCNTEFSHINGSSEGGGSNYSQLFKKRVRADKYSSRL